VAIPAQAYTDNRNTTMNSFMPKSLQIIDKDFHDFIEREVLPHVDVEAENFWNGLGALLEEFTPRNRELLEVRQQLQNQIDLWHDAHVGEAVDPDVYAEFLKEIGYLLDEGEDFEIRTANVDKEITEIAGPQLVVPLDNARFALNAANARWGSLYDALYGSDVIPQDGDLSPGTGYNPVRGEAVIDIARGMLDEIAPLSKGSHHDVLGYRIFFRQLLVMLEDGSCAGLANPSCFVGFEGEREDPDAVLLKHNGLHIEIQIDRAGTIGSRDKAGIDDIQLESAVTTIVDCEDSVAAVDAEDKLVVYRNWLGLMRGTLHDQFEKDGKLVNRSLGEDREYISPNDEVYRVPGRSLLFNRNVGLLMDIDLIKDAEGAGVPEGIIDTVVTALIGSIDLDQHVEARRQRNSRTGSIYIVKPKLHGPDEVQFTCDLMAAVESLLGMPVNTIKLGIMDEERRTTVNLKECIRVARDRIVFINTGFLDRTGDEISTSMSAGAFCEKAELRNQPWLGAYEARNVALGLQTGFQGRAQIGKGMWAMPDHLKQMLEEKIAHPRAGASTAWVPSPTAATLHALHYHKVDVHEIQQQKLTQSSDSTGEMLRDILTIPLLDASTQPGQEAITRELENNIQGILGYVVRWVEHGIGCSKVNDINDVPLMEDRATLRISSTHIANWLLHGLVNRDQIEMTLRRMAIVVDEQNANSPGYVPMSADFDNSLGFQAARALIFANLDQPSGYTEPLLYEYRRKMKARLSA